MRNFRLLLKIRLDESLNMSRMKYSDSPKARIEGLAFMAVKALLFCCLFAIVYGVCAYFGRQGLSAILPTMAYILALVLSFLMTVVNMNELITGNEDSEFLLSTPMSELNHVFIMFLTLYVKSLVYVVVLCVPAVMVYASYTATTVGFLICWVLGLMLTSLPLGGLGALMGMGITLTLAENPKKEQIQTGISLFLSVICMVVILSLVDRVGSVMLKGLSDAPSVLADNIIKVMVKNFFFGRFYYHAVMELNGAYLFLFILISLLWYLAIAMLVGFSYRIMTISLRCPVQYKIYEWTEQRQKQIEKALMLRERELFFKSRSYMTKSLTGILAGVIIPLNFMLISPEKFLRIFSLERYTESLCSALPLIICFFVGLCCTSYCSFSIEGRRHWIIDTIPQDRRLIYRCKAKLNLFLTVPFSVISGVLFSIAFHVTVRAALEMILVPVGYAILNAYWGIYIDDRFGTSLKESEAQAMHQGASYLLGYLPGVIIPIIGVAARLI